METLFSSPPPPPKKESSSVLTLVGPITIRPPMRLQYIRPLGCRSVTRFSMSVRVSLRGRPAKKKMDDSQQHDFSM